MIDSYFTAYMLMKTRGLRLCNQGRQWILIGPNGRQPPPHDLPMSEVAPGAARELIEHDLVIDIFAGRHGKYESPIYHLKEEVPTDTLAYIARCFPAEEKGQE